MIILSEKQIQEIYGMNQAIKDVESMLIQKRNGKIINPQRTVIEFPKEDGSVLYMPSTDLKEEIMSMKAVTIFPKNPTKGKNTTQGVILISDAINGDHVAMLNASYLTRLRTGAMTGLATDKLSLDNASVLTVIGTGGMAFEQVLGVLAVRKINKILLINPTIEKAYLFKEKLRNFGVESNVQITVSDDVSEAVKQAHIICCSTRSHDPVFDGSDLEPGTHVNGVGSYLPHMREVDCTFIQRTNKIVVDDLLGAQEEAGELIHAVKQQIWSFERIHGELMDLVGRHVAGREKNNEITFFKSVGAAYYDLAVANGVYKEAIKKNVGTKVDI